jgi:hypothetical protein
VEKFEASTQQGQPSISVRNKGGGDETYIASSRAPAVVTATKLEKLDDSEAMTKLQVINTSNGERVQAYRRGEFPVPSRCETISNPDLLIASSETDDRGGIRS